MIIKIQNLRGKIETDNPKLLKAIREFFSTPMPGARYSPAYGRHWDGKKYFITEKGVFKTGLTNSILEALKKIPDLEVEVTDVSEWPKVAIDRTKKITSYTLYDYQEEAVNKALDTKRLIVKSPTGSGKTLIMAQLVNNFPEAKIVILFNSKHLLKQTYKFFETCGIKEVGVNFGEGYLDGRIMLSTIQSIQRILDPYVVEGEVLMVDEVHEFAAGKTSQAVLDSFPKAQYRFGFTATPPPDKYRLLSLTEVLGEVYEVRSVKELIEDDVLTRPNIKILNFQYSNEEACDNYYSSYPDTYEKYVTNEKRKSDYLKDLIIENSQSKDHTRHLILVKSLAHLEKLKKILQRAGLYVLTIEGKDDLDERYRAVKDFRDTQNAILIGTKVLQTGVSIDEITHFYNLRELKSEISTIQALGRALRKYKEKPEVFVFDFSTTNIRYLSAHRTERIKTYKKEGYDVRELEIP